MSNITPVKFKLVIEDVSEEIILHYTTGCPSGFLCTVCSTREDRPGFFEFENQEWMCAHCAFNPKQRRQADPGRAVKAPAYFIAALALAVAALAGIWAADALGFGHDPNVHCYGKNC